jgi:benzoylformate decarboxylase
VAERLGAPVYCESGTTHGRLPFPCNHPLSGPGLPLWSPEVRERLMEFDVVLVAGMDLLRQYLYHEPSRAIPEHVKLVQIDEDPWQLGKNYQVEVGVIGDSKSSLAELAELVSATATSEQSQRAARRAARWTKQHAAARDALNQRIAQQRDVRPMTPLAMMGALAEAMTPSTAVVEEAVTTTNTTLERLGAIGEPSGYFGHRGWALGWGLGVAVGVKLAWPDRPVLAVLGDGAAMYGIQGLWSAAHHRIPVTFVIANNAQYEILKVGARGLQLPRAGESRFLGMDLVDPEIDFVALAQSLGVDACRVAEPDELTRCVAESLRSDRPLLIDVPIQRQLPDRLQYG